MTIMTMTTRRRTMTERALPPVSVGGHRSRPADPTHPAAAQGCGRPPARPASPAGTRASVRRNETVLSTPARAGLLLGATAAAYAVSLAGVSALEADADAQVIAARAPYLDEVARLQAANDELDRLVREADAGTRALAADYGAVGAAVTGYEARLDALAGLVANIEGSVAAMPDRIRLPSVRMRGAIAGSSRSGRLTAPATSATSGASGG
jgi:hypothetical protein